MTWHVYATFLTPHGVAANNRGEVEGNRSTLQKITWSGHYHSTVSSEAIRFALRQKWQQEIPEQLHRLWDEKECANHWRDADKENPPVGDPERYLDDDLMGYMFAVSGSQTKADVRKSRLEITRAISLHPWTGDVFFGVASPGSSSGGKDPTKSDPVPYVAEVHATSYQYSVAVTPESCEEPERALRALQDLTALSGVGGNHARYLFDFAAASGVVRVTTDPAARILYCFEPVDGSLEQAGLGKLCRLLGAGTVAPDELFIGGYNIDPASRDQLRELGVDRLYPSAKDAVDAACQSLRQHLGES